VHTPKANKTKERCLSDGLYLHEIKGKGLADKERGRKEDFILPWYVY
jgi:hypothetical protein